MRTEEVLERLEGVKGAGQDRWLARCPGHPDRTPSLSVAVGDDGRTLLHCHAGCPVDEITAGMNLTPADLFEKQNGNGHKEIANIYGYCDEKGELLYEVVRYYPKDFRQRKPDGHGGWTWKLGDTRRVLWKLPKVLEAAKAGERVAIAEGERDVEALEAKGLVATTNPGGAGKWRPEYTEALRGAQVGIFADKDEPGRRHAADVARSLEGIAASVKILEGAVGKDIAEHFAHGKELSDVIDVTETVVPITAIEKQDETGRRLRILDVEGMVASNPPEVPWVIEGLDE